MKSANRIARTMASTLLIVAAFASASFAATTPLNYPRGLALDAKGNLYVANYGGNQILVYSPTYVQIGSKMISSDITGPTGVAFNPLGDLWVANYATNLLTRYSPTGAEVGFIQNGIQGPGAITVDGDVWVQKDQASVSVYDLYGHPLKTIPPPVIQ